MADLGTHVDDRGKPADLDFEDFVPSFEDLAASRFLAGLVAGAAVTLVLLRVAGFRFSFGASIGGGG